MLQTKQQAVLDGFRPYFFTELTETPSLCAISLYVGHPVAKAETLHVFFRLARPAAVDEL